MMTVAVTGGIGSGKSELCRWLAVKGVPVYDSDSRAKALYDGRPSIVADLEESLGCPLRDVAGRFDKRRLAEEIFSDSGKLAAVEAIVHPAILDDFWRWAASQGEVDIVAFESAIILEKPLFRGVADYVVLVDAPASLRMERACGRDGKSREEVSRRMEAQRFDPSRADRVIVNDSDLDHLHREAERLLADLRKALKDRAACPPDVGGAADK